MELNPWKLQARDHANETGHHTVHIAGEGWVCEQCDADFAEWIERTVATHSGTISHFDGSRS